jgi:hypothetical protein
MNVAFFSPGDPVPFTINKDTGLVTGIKVFRTGTFKDSAGVQHTWTPEHLEEMVFHFNMLKSSGVLPNVPWRIDHSRSVLGVVGYFEKMYAEDGFLFADVHFTEPNALDGMARGTFRSRSLEVGVYETNDEAFYWPVVTGCAFVDLPAVEGLYSAPQVHHTVLYEKESNQMFTIDGKEVTKEEWEKAVAYAQALVDLEAVPASEAETLRTERDAAKDAAKTAVAAMGAHAKGEAHQFQINGQPTPDVVAVQAHITTLETFKSETMKSARSAYVTKLAQENKIPATIVESQVNFVQSLTDAQYDEYTKTWDTAPVSSLLAVHGAGGNGGSPAPDAPAVTELEHLREMVKMHQRAGTPNIENTESYKRLQQLEAAAAK